jgi:hypothetical protein
MAKYTVRLERHAREELFRAFDNYVQLVTSDRSITPKPFSRRPSGPRSDDVLFTPVVELVQSSGVIGVEAIANTLCMSRTRARRVAKALAAQGRVEYDRGRVSPPKVSISGKRLGRPSKAPHYAKVVEAYLGSQPFGARTSDILVATDIPFGTWPTVRKQLVDSGTIVATPAPDGRGFVFSLPKPTNSDKDLKS